MKIKFSWIQLVWSFRHAEEMLGRSVHSSFKKEGIYGVVKIMWIYLCRGAGEKEKSI